jgi:hypothetical protein
MGKKITATGDLSTLVEKIKRRLPDIHEKLRISDPVGEAQTHLNQMGVTDSGDSDSDCDIAERMLAVYVGQPIENSVREIGDFVCRAIQSGDSKTLRQMSDRLNRIVRGTERDPTPVQKLLDLKQEFIRTQRRPPRWAELRARALQAFPVTFAPYKDDSREWSRWRKVPGLNKLHSGKPGRPKKMGDK